MIRSLEPLEATPYMYFVYKAHLHGAPLVRGPSSKLSSDFHAFEPATPTMLNQFPSNMPFGKLRV